LGSFYLPEATLPIFNDNVAVQYLGIYDEQESGTLLNIKRDLNNLHRGLMHGLLHQVQVNLMNCSSMLVTITRCFSPLQLHKNKD